LIVTNERDDLPVAVDRIFPEHFSERNQSRTAYLVAHIFDKFQVRSHLLSEISARKSYPQACTKKKAARTSEK
jgi:hypothetical protein